MGQPIIYLMLPTEYIGWLRVPPELKHLSKERKREQQFIPLVVASEKGTAQT
jgi:hypothetical protein